MQDQAETAPRFILRSTKAQKRFWFDTSYEAHAVCKCGHEQGYHDGEHCSGVQGCDCRGFRRAA